MAAGETPLQMVSRHMAEGEGHIARQLLLIERLRTPQASTEGAAAMLVEAEALLVEFKSTQTAHVAHLCQIREEQGAGLRDADGILSLR